MVSAVAWQPVCSTISLISGKRTGKFMLISLISSSPARKSRLSELFTRQFPTHRNRELSEAEQGLNKMHQGARTTAIRSQSSEGWSLKSDAVMLRPSNGYSAPCSATTAIFSLYQRKPRESQGADQMISAGKRQRGSEISGTIPLLHEASTSKNHIRTDLGSEIFSFR